MTKPDFSNIKKIEFAPSMEIERRQKAVDGLMRIIATTIFGCDEGEDADDWLRHCLVTDLSTIGDFAHHDGDLEKLDEALGFQVTGHDYIYEVAMRLVPPS